MGRKQNGRHGKSGYRERMEIDALMTTATEKRHSETSSEKRPQGRRAPARGPRFAKQNGDGKRGARSAFFASRSIQNLRDFAFRASHFCFSRNAKTEGFLAGFSKKCFRLPQATQSTEGCDCVCFCFSPLRRGGRQIFAFCLLFDCPLLAMQLHDIQKAIICIKNDIRMIGAANKRQENVKYMSCRLSQICFTTREPPYMLFA